MVDNYWVREWVRELFRKRGYMSARSDGEFEAMETLLRTERDSIQRRIDEAVAAADHGCPYCDQSREQKAAHFVKESGKRTHASDCATSVAPAEEPGRCDCGEAVTNPVFNELCGLCFGLGWVGEEHNRTRCGCGKPVTYP